MILKCINIGLLIFQFIIIRGLSQNNSLILQHDYNLRYENYILNQPLKLYESDVSVDDQINAYCDKHEVDYINCRTIKEHALMRISKFFASSNDNRPIKINTIWILWWQGWDQAHPVVVKCLESWRHHHSSIEWNVISIDKNNIGNFIDLNEVVPDGVIESLTLAALSDIIRWMLLYKYGGVWVDSTVFCHKPLTTWLNLTYSNSNTCHESTDINNNSCFLSTKINQNYSSRGQLSLMPTELKLIDSFSCEVYFCGERLLIYD